jgi:hypothetical protein
LAEHHEHPVGVERQLDRPGDPGDDDFDTETFGHLGGRGGTRARGEEPSESAEEESCSPGGVGKMAPKP